MNEFPSKTYNKNNFEVYKYPEKWCAIITIISLMMQMPLGHNLPTLPYTKARAKVIANNVVHLTPDFIGKSAGVHCWIWVLCIRNVH